MLRVGTMIPRLLGVFGVVSMAGVAALGACTTKITDTNTNSAADAAPAKADGTSDAAVSDAGRTLDAGGALSAPFTCQVDSIQHEPRPGIPLLEQLRVAAGLDVLEERLAIGASDAGANASARAGVPCSGATDHDACEAAFAQLSSAEALRPAFDEVDYMAALLDGSTAGPPGYYLAYTKGDAVGKVSNRTELAAVFPIIDSPAKALLYANAAGYRVECQHAEGWLREETGGWVLIASRGHERRCSRTDVVLFLRRDGTTEERDVIENQPDACT